MQADISLGGMCVAGVTMFGCNSVACPRMIKASFGTSTGTAEYTEAGQTQGGLGCYDCQLPCCKVIELCTLYDWVLPCCRTRCRRSTSCGLSLSRAPTTALAWLYCLLVLAGFCGVAAPDLTGVPAPEAGLEAGESCAAAAAAADAALAAWVDCLDKADDGRVERPTAWLRPPILRRLGLLTLMRAASSTLQQTFLVSEAEFDMISCHIYARCFPVMHCNSLTQETTA